MCLQELSPSTIASVFRTLVYSRRGSSELSGLFELPAASRLSSREVCDLLLLAVRKEARCFYGNLTE